jgi:AP-3 complex subunit beta
VTAKPKKEKKKTEWGDFGNSSSQSSSEEEEEEDEVTPDLDPDHRLLLKAVLPLLKSRNASVVMGVATLYFYLAPKDELPIVARPLTRLLRSTKEIEFVALATIADMAAARPVRQLAFTNNRLCFLKLLIIVFIF